MQDWRVAPIHKGLLSGFILWLLTTLYAEAAGDYFQIQVTDSATGRGIPLVELETVNNIVFITDSAGRVAFHEPGMMDQDVFFHVRSHGYQFPVDGFGFRGLKLRTTPGQKATVKLARQNIAERLYRITGQGIYRDTVLLGEEPPIQLPVLNGLVLGSDSVVNALYRDRLYWFWGDTNRASYPLGNFHVPGATSELPEQGGLRPDQGVNLTYFTASDGFAKPVASIPGPGPTWIFGLTTLTNGNGQQELWTGYSKIEPPLKVYARGVARFDDQQQAFENMRTFPQLPILYPEGQALALQEADTEHIYFCTPYPLVRVRATPDAFQDPQQYEAWTCLEAGSTESAPRFVRTAKGQLRFAWTRATPAFTPALQRQFHQQGRLSPTERPLPLQDATTGQPISAHTGTVNWNEWRQRWIMLFVELGGTSQLGEMWYAEADSPLGPWEYAVKVATHQKYSFYNPRHHRYFDQEGGRTIYFEGTYTHSFSGNPHQTPRYDYNQLMYRLDLADERLVLPRPVHSKVDKGSWTFATCREALTLPDQSHPFLAYDRSGPATIPIYRIPAGPSHRLVTVEASLDAHVAFHALPVDMTSPPATTGLLYEYVNETEKTFHYDLSDAWQAPGFGGPRPICRVWRPTAARAPERQD